MEDNDIKIWTKEEFVKMCSLCKQGVITGSSIKQLNNRMKMHQTSKRCIKKHKEINNARK